MAVSKNTALCLCALALLASGQFAAAQPALVDPAVVDPAAATAAAAAIPQAPIDPAAATAVAPAAVDPAAATAAAIPTAADPTTTVPTQTPAVLPGTVEATAAAAAVLPVEQAGVLGDAAAPPTPRRAGFRASRNRGNAVKAAAVCVVQATGCGWAGHCAGAACRTYNDCGGSMICLPTGKCGCTGATPPPPAPSPAPPAATVCRQAALPAVADAAWAAGCDNVKPTQTCTAACAAGFTGNGFASTCSSAATWSAPAGTGCTKVQPPPPSPVAPPPPPTGSRNTTITGYNVMTTDNTAIGALVGGFVDNVPIVAVLLRDWPKFANTQVDITYKGITSRLYVLDLCDDRDCTPAEGACCTKNANLYGAAFLIDIDAAAAKRAFGVIDAENTLEDKATFTPVLNSKVDFAALQAKWN